MTESEIKAATDKFLNSRRGVLEKIAIEARAVIPVLLDAGRTNSAKALQELLFQYDAAEQEFSDLMNKDPEGVVRLVRSLLGRKSAS